MRPLTPLFIVLLATALPVASCSAPSEPREERSEPQPVEVRIESYGVVIDNYTDAPIYYNAYRTGALALFDICVEPDRCASVPARSTGTVPFDRVTAWEQDARSVDIDYWHLVPAGEGFAPDTVRKVIATR